MKIDKTIITLTNGKRVGNFSSNHPFTFVDGNILPAVSNEDCKRLAVTFNECVDEDGDVSLFFSLNDKVISEMDIWTELWLSDKVDIIYCPLPMIQALYGMGYDVKNSPFRAVRIEDRVNKLLSIEKQCI